MNKRIAAWLSWLEDDRQLAPGTCKLYERTILSLQRDLSPSSPFEKLTASDLRSWLHDRGGSPSSYGNRVAALKSFYGFLMAKGHIRENPASSLDVPKAGPSTREPVPDLEAALTSLDEVDRRANESGVVPRRVGESRDMARFLAETGMRVSDACQLSEKRPIPAEIRIPRRRRPDSIFKLNNEARAALDRLEGRFDIGTRALQRRFEKAGFHPDQLRHWYRINRENEGLRDRRLEQQGGAEADDHSEYADAISMVQRDGGAAEALRAMGRLLGNTEEAVTALVRDARRQGWGWSEIAQALAIPESSARERFGLTA